MQLAKPCKHTGVVLTVVVKDEDEEDFREQKR